MDLLFVSSRLVKTGLFVSVGAVLSRVRWIATVSFTAPSQCRVLETVRERRSCFEVQRRVARGERAADPLLFRIFLQRDRVPQRPPHGRKSAELQNQTDLL